MTMAHDHVTNGIAPVKGCEVCSRIVRSSIRDMDKRPEGRLPPWLWGDHEEALAKAIEATRASGHFIPDTAWLNDDTEDE